MSKSIAIVKNEPMPKAAVGRPKTTAYPFEALKINDSFCAGKFSDDLYAQINNQSYYYGTKLNRKFSVRRIENENGVFEIKVWRTA